VANTKKRAATPLIDLMFQAFCHRMRVRILHLLAQGEMCVCNIVEIVQAPQPKVSRHLGVLKKAKLVTVRREGQWIFYSLAPVQSTFHQKLLECAAHCVHEVTEIREDEQRLEAMRSRASGCCTLSTNGLSQVVLKRCCTSGN
jgi:ArsR family transcriptional regulator, arsenate/arsenite/antimonite-responsive transcriptional repressor